MIFDDFESYHSVLVGYTLRRAQRENFLVLILHCNAREARENFFPH